ncbi:MAG: hypothetical protein KatS3mg039_0862 [Candidatus Kapaibacterium sp.]|nr:MAG: hypothetical protein KatS3mg039_0862 [Candidatus Kapabacteria bacterium]
MKRFDAVTCCVFLALALAVPCAQAQEKLLVAFNSPEVCQQYISRTATARVLVPVDLATKRTTLQNSAQGSDLTRWIDSLRKVAVVYTSNPDSLLRRMRWEPGISAVWVPQRYHIETSRTGDEPVPLPSQWYLDSLKARQAWRIATGSGIVVGVIDTGIDWLHPVLESSLWVNAAEDLNRNGRFDPWPSTEQRDGVYGDLDGTDNDGNGFADDVVGFSFVNQAPPPLGLGAGPFPYDQNGHGTAVAAVIAARSPDNRGLMGLAFEARVMALRAFDLTGVGQEDDIAVAIIYAVLNGARIINCSFGDIVRSKLIAFALAAAEAADVVVVASSGNSGSATPHYPSDEPTVLSIGASTESGRVAVFSSYGERLFLLAPGQDILTAAAGGGFTSVSGTSFAAPLVSATAALLRSANPMLTAEQTRVVLAESASPLVGKWNPRSGHGIVSPLAALERSFLLGTVRITEPFHRSRWRSLRGSLAVGMNVLHPLLERWELLASVGSTAMLLDSGDGAAIGYHRHFDSFPSASDTPVVIRLRAYLRTGKTIEDAAVLESDPEQLSIDQARAVMVWVGSRRQLAGIVLANRPCEVRADVVDDRGQQVASAWNDGQFRRLHTVLLDVRASGVYRIRFTVWDDTDTTVAVLDSIRTMETVVSKADWQPRPYTAEPLLLSGSKVVAPGSFIATQMAVPQHAVVLERNQDTFRMSVLANRTLFLRGIGDTDGDGRREVLTYDAGQTRLYQFDPVPLGKVIWGDTTTGSFWAAGLADITGDGRAEVLGFRTRRVGIASDGSLQPRSDALVALSWDGSSYHVLDSIELASVPRGGRTINTITAPACAVGDFDRDGAIEIAYADSDGDLEIAEWRDGRFVLEYGAPPQPFLAGAGTEFVVAADVDGDSAEEVFFAAPALPAYNTIGEYEPPLWHLALLKSTAANQYSIVWEDFVWGVRYGRPYYNGVAAGDLTRDGKAEIIASLFPNAYVLTWNGTALVPLLVCDSVWSNGALVADFDGGGTTELALTRGLIAPRTVFYQYAPAVMQAPSILEAYQTLDSGLFCRWSRRDTGEIFTVRISGDVVAETADTVLVVPSVALPSCRECRVEIRAVRGNDSSNWSDPAIVIRGEFLRIDRVEPTTEGAQMLHFTVRGYLPPKGIPADALIIERDDVRWHATFTVASGNQTLVVWLSAPLVAGTYRVALIEGTRDGYGNPSPASEAVLIVQPGRAEEEFHVEQVVEATHEAVAVRFSAEPDAATLPLKNVQVHPYGSIIAIEQQSDPRVLRFVLDQRFRYESRGLLYWFVLPPTFRSVQGVPMTRGSGNTVAWMYAPQSSDSTRAFPQPWSRSRHAEIRFSHVPLGASVVVTTLGGIEISQIPCTDPAGGVRWVPRLSNGSLLPEGIYLYAVRNADGSQGPVQKFVVVP